MEQMIMEILQDGQKLFWVLTFVFLVLLAFMSTVTKVLTTIASERTKRDIAAYIAEGAMTPEQGERLVKAGKKTGSGCC